MNKLTEYMNLKPWTWKKSFAFVGKSNWLKLIPTTVMPNTKAPNQTEPLEVGFPLTYSYQKILLQNYSQQYPADTQTERHRIY